MKDHALRDAEHIIEEACRHYEMVEADLLHPRRGDWKRASIASRIWRETNVTQCWLAERLGLRSPANVSQTIRRFKNLERNKLGKREREWRRLSEVVDCPLPRSHPNTHRSRRVFHALARRKPALMQCHSP